MVAFELACAGSPDSRLHFAQWHALWSRLKPRRAHYSRIVFKCLDQDNLSNLDLFEFFRLSDVVHLSFSEAREPTARRERDPRLLGALNNARGAAFLASVVQRRTLRERAADCARSLMRACATSVCTGAATACAGASSTGCARAGGRSR
jgi:hypothetical protein